MKKPGFGVAAFLVTVILLTTPALVSLHQTRRTAELQAELQLALEQREETVARLEEANRLFRQKLSESAEACAAEKRTQTVPLRYCLVECKCPNDVWATVGQQPLGLRSFIIAHLTKDSPPEHAPFELGFLFLCHQPKQVGLERLGVFPAAPGAQLPEQCALTL